MDSTVEVIENQEISITNKLFLAAIFGVDWKMAHVTSFPDDPGGKRSGKDTRWSGHQIGERKLPAGNQYFAISLFKLVRGRAVRTKDSFISCHVIVVDDVGTKISIELIASILPPPSYILETSHGCFQYGWILNEPCRDRRMVENLLEGLVQKLAPDGKDPGMLGVTRYCRLPEGYNSKASRLVAGEPFKCRLLRCEPWSELFTMAQLADSCGADLHAGRKESNITGAADVNHPLIDVIEIKSKLSSGKYDITCPWVDEHTGGDDSGTAAWTNADLSIGFKCHHGHCHDRTGKDLIEHIEDDNPGWAKKLDAWKTYRELGVDKDIDDIEVLESIDSIVPESVRPVPPTMKEILDELLADFARLPKTEIAEEHAFKIMRVAEKCDKVVQIRAHDRIRDYLGWSIKEFKVVLKEQRAKWYAQLNTGKYKQISFHTFPDKKVSENNIRLYDTVANTRHLLKEYKITTQLDQITKENIFIVPGENSTDEATMLEMIIGLVRFHDLPQVNILHRLFNECRANPINSVVEHLSGLDYKGVGFIQQLSEHVTVESETEHIRDQVLRMWMIMACAGADHAESTPNKEAVAKFDSVMIFVGEQGLKKTQFFRAILPAPLRQYFNDGVMIDPTDRDSVSQAVALWVIEAGEIDGLFKKVDLERFKAFLSKSFDVFRKPFGRLSVKYQRRTVFVGSANEREFLKDHTGNRRYWPLLVEAIAIPTDEDLISRAWSEAWTAYKSGEQWWPDEGFEKILSGQTRSFQVPITDEPVEEAIRAMIESKMGVFKQDILKLRDIREALKISGLSGHNIERIPSLQMLGRIMMRHELGVSVRTATGVYWYIRDFKRYSMLANADIERIYKSSEVGGNKSSLTKAKPFF